MTLLKEISRKGRLFLCLAMSKIQRAYTTHLTEVGQRKPKIRIVAIAKNESAYLPEWIFHHLYFGFDSIEIYYNRCSDETLSLIKHFEHETRVDFINADNIFETNSNPQCVSYKRAMKKARAEGFSDVLFIDVDEFWMPLDCKSTIIDCVSTMPDYDVINFEWINKFELAPIFTRALSHQLQFVRASQLKSLIKTYVFPVTLNPHNVVEKGLKYINALGDTIKFANAHYSKVGSAEQALPLKPYVILHRMIRSQEEYIALLSKGRPHIQSSHEIAIKNNRAGIPKRDLVEEHLLPLTELQAYQKYMDLMLDDKELTDIVARGREFVMSSYRNILNVIATAPRNAAPLLEKSLRNIDLPDIDNAMRQFKRNIGQS